ncbi:hypothetical protein WMY93_013196 [Mugilogobius chulae]|uniref:L1 transposable element RRM domain-containing protein n=1 Tax=Mugilogobius chulae TaxID=88201 RepID=A0AAW0P303_9GOBI
MSQDGPSTRNKERKEADHLSSNVLQELKALASKIDGLELSFKKQLNTKVDSLHASMQALIAENKEWFKAELSLKTTEIQKNMDNEISVLISRIEKMEAKIDRSSMKASTRFDTDVSIVVSGLPYNEGENVTALVNELLSEGLQLEDACVVAVERTKDRGGRPGVVKVEFGSVREKIGALRKKQMLKSNPKYSRVYIRSAKTHTERLLELNFRTLLDEMPAGRQFYVAGNGRVRRRPLLGSGAGAEASGGSEEGTRRTDI